MLRRSYQSIIKSSVLDLVLSVRKRSGRLGRTSLPKVRNNFGDYLAVVLFIITFG